MAFEIIKNERSLSKKGDKYIFTLSQEQEYDKTNVEAALKNITERLKNGADLIKNIDTLKEEIVVNITKQLDEKKKHFEDFLAKPEEEKLEEAKNLILQKQKLANDFLETIEEEAEKSKKQVFDGLDEQLRIFGEEKPNLEHMKKLIEDNVASD